MTTPQTVTAGTVPDLYGDCMTSGATSQVEGAPEAARRLHAFTDDALGDHDAVALAELLRDGAVSPRDLVDAAIDRCRGIDSTLRAVAHPAYDDARRRATREVTGWFGGVPTLVKDNVDVAGQPTQQGSTAWVAKPATHDSVFTTQLLSTGLVSLGKSTLPEFGFNASTEFADGEPTRNPWHLDHSPGASSGGSAALVAAGVVPIAHANDGGGSIRIPAAACGLVGLKPTRDRLLTDRLVRQMPVRLVANGVVTRSVRDSAAFLREAERHHRNLSLPPLGDVARPGRRRLRVGLLVDAPTGYATDAATRAVVEGMAGLLEDLGHRVEPVASPVGRGFADDFETYWGMLAFFLVHQGRRTFGPDFDRTLVDNLTGGLAGLFSRRAHRAPGVIVRLRRTRRRTAELFRRVDVLLTPTLAHAPPPLGHLSPAQDFGDHLARLRDYVGFTPLQNVTGEPAVSLPAGHAPNGLPIGVQFAAGWGCERTLLELALEVEEARPWTRIQD